jgi:hypothetical protein
MDENRWNRVSESRNTSDDQKDYVFRNHSGETVGNIDAAEDSAVSDGHDPLLRPGRTIRFRLERDVASSWTQSPAPWRFRLGKRFVAWLRWDGDEIGTEKDQTMMSMRSGLMKLDAGVRITGVCNCSVDGHSLWMRLAEGRLGD